MLQTRHPTSSQSLATREPIKKNEINHLQRSNPFIVRFFKLGLIRVFVKIWQNRLHAACKEHGLNYFEFTESLTRVCPIVLNYQLILLSCNSQCFKKAKHSFKSPSSQRSGYLRAENI